MKMVKRFFLITTLAIAVAWSMLFIYRGDYSKEAIFAWVITALMIMLINGFFVMKNKEAIGKMTKEPSSENLKIMLGLISRKRTKEQ